jgi:hypothetical protein
VLFKLDRSGECDHVRLADLPLNRTLSFVGFDHDNFIEVRAPQDLMLCVASSCSAAGELTRLVVRLCSDTVWHPPRMRLRCGWRRGPPSDLHLPFTAGVPRRCACSRAATLCRRCRAWASRRRTRSCAAIATL